MIIGDKEKEMWYSASILFIEWWYIALWDHKVNGNISMYFRIKCLLFRE